MDETLDYDIEIEKLIDHLFPDGVPGNCETSSTHYLNRILYPLSIYRAIPQKSRFCKIYS